MAADLTKYTTVKALNSYITGQEKKMNNAKKGSKAYKTAKANIDAAKAKKKSIKAEKNDKGIDNFNALSKWQPSDDTGDSYLKNRAKAFGSSGNKASSIEHMMKGSMNSIEGAPYQFSATVDRRLNTNTKSPLDNSGIGRKYAEKIVSRFPLLFIQPCTVEYMRGFNNDNKTTMTDALLNKNDIPSNFSELLSQNGKYYTVDFAYKEYYQYFNCMMNALAIYLGIGGVKLTVGSGSNKYSQELRSFRWENEMDGSPFATYFSARENLIFYVDGFSSVSQSFSNETGDSSLASTINGFADQINEIKFLFGTDGAVVNEVYGMATDITSSITSHLSASLGKLGGGIVESLANSGVNTILNGGKIIFPEIWTNSGMDDGSATFDFKFRSPDNDTLSIYLNVLKPYCKLLCLTLPHQSRIKGSKYDPHSFMPPFVLKAGMKGKFAVDTGIIAGLSVTKGAECQWNDDGLPTQIDISVDVKNLYKNMSISSYDQSGSSIVNNTAYMDFVANMAGLNIMQMEMFRKQKYFVYFTANKITGFPSNLGSAASQGISRIMGRIYDLTS